MLPTPTPEGAAAIRERISLLKSELAQGQSALRAAYEARDDALQLLRGRCQLVDEVLKALWQDARLPPGLCLVAVGGYGRRELYPASDIDLLFLLPDNVAQATERQLEALAATL